jgi:Tol biopolymer transport system component
MHLIRLARRPILGLALCAILSPLAGCGSGRQSGSSRTNAATKIRPSLSGVIVFRRFFDAAHHTGAIFTVSADGRGERQISHPPTGEVDSLDGPPGFTPDGSAFIFDRTDANGNGSLWRVGADGSHEHRIPTLAGLPGDGWPTISPDGQTIAVPRAWGKLDRYQDLKVGLYVIHLDGSSPRLVAPFGYTADVSGATWSPDGRELVFAVLNNGPGRPANASALFAVSADGQGLHRITPWDTNGVIWSPAFSPDGKLVLFWIRPQDADYGGDYFTIHPDGTHRRKLTNFPAGSNTGNARWSPDGKWIVFANTGTAGTDDLYTMRANGSHITPLTRTAAWESAPEWVP